MENYRYSLCPTSAMCLLLHLLPVCSFFVMVCTYVLGHQILFYFMAELFADLRCSPSCTCAGIHGTVSLCPPDCFQYKSTLDVFYKIIRQEGFARLWRGTNAGLALAVPTVGIYLPCYDILWRRILCS